MAIKKSPMNSKDFANNKNLETLMMFGGVGEALTPQRFSSSCKGGLQS